MTSYSSIAQSYILTLRSILQLVIDDIMKLWPQSNHLEGVRLAILLLICVLASDLLAQSKPTADLIITNAKVWTADKAHTDSASCAVLGDRIAAVDSNAHVEVLRGTSTKVIDADGRSLLPGFNDAYVHFVRGGLQLHFKPHAS
jgi:hypothetical protein